MPISPESDGYYTFYKVARTVCAEILVKNQLSVGE